MGYILMFMIVIILALFLFLTWYLFVYKIENLQKQDLPKLEDLSSFDYQEFSEPVKVNFQEPRWDAQSQEWKDALGLIARQLKAHHVKSVYLVHGTFVGSDPFDLKHLFEEMQAFKTFKFNTSWIKKFVAYKKAFMQDLGNFTPEYFDLLAKGCEGLTQVKRFEWTSGNHHYARLAGALDLAKKIVDDFEEDTDRILICGHSHAGQIFAILTQMIADPVMGKILLDFAIEGGYEDENVLQQLAKLKGKGIDFVTLGSPKRYEWSLGENQRLLHLINHRSENPEVKIFSGVLNIQNGDYVQLWAGEGSDSPSPVKLQAQVNRKLDHILDVGADMKLWKDKPRTYHRLHTQGHTLLINFKDNDQKICFAQTLFGHGVYTRYTRMLYQFSQIQKYFYP